MQEQIYRRLGSCLAVHANGNTQLLGSWPGACTQPLSGEIRLHHWKRGLQAARPGKERKAVERYF